MTDPAKQARDEAVDRVDRNANEQWKQNAFAAVRRLALRGTEFTTDDVWAELGTEEGTHEKRAMAP